MLKNERELEIIKLLRSNPAVSHAQLSQILDASQNTVRRDLDRLSKQGMIKRVRGGAVSFEENRGNDDLEWIVRQQTLAEEKQRIGKACAGLINEGESVFLDAGTTIMEIARQLDTLRNTMILTNAVNISMELAKNDKITVILTGGVFREISRSLVGTIVEDFIRSSVHVDKMFLSAGGINVEDGVTNANLIEISM
jgi:DeoR/GlpR family transcriptional regulator of sugar metabolism